MSRSDDDIAMGEDEHEELFPVDDWSDGQCAYCADDPDHPDPDNPDTCACPRGGCGEGHCPRRDADAEALEALDDDPGAS